MNLKHQCKSVRKTCKKFLKSRRIKKFSLKNHLFNLRRKRELFLKIKIKISKNNSNELKKNNALVFEKLRKNIFLNRQKTKNYNRKCMYNIINLHRNKNNTSKHGSHKLNKKPSLFKRITLIFRKN